MDETKDGSMDDVWTKNQEWTNPTKDRSMDNIWTKSQGWMNPTEDGSMDNIWMNPLTMPAKYG